MDTNDLVGKYCKITLNKPFNTHYAKDIKNAVVRIESASEFFLLCTTGFTSPVGDDPIIEHKQLIDRSLIKSIQKCRTDIKTRGRKEWYVEYKGG